MHYWQLGLLLICGIITGAVNSVAGGGSLWMYPLLLSFGIPPVVANATSSVVVFPGMVSSSVGYRKYIKQIPKHYFFILIPCVLGSLLGAELLHRTPDNAFEFIVPWFILLAAILLAIQPNIHKILDKNKSKKTKNKITAGFIFLLFIVFAIAIYGGYFGAAAGIVLLAFLGFTQLSNLQQMNGLKSLATVCISGVASAYFIYRGIVYWPILPALVVGTLFGGWFGATFSSLLPEKGVRLVAVVVSFAVAIVLFWQQYF